MKIYDAAYISESPPDCKLLRLHQPLDREKIADDETGKRGTEAIILRTAQLEQVLVSNPKASEQRNLQIFINLFIYFAMKIGNGWQHSQNVSLLFLSFGDVCYKKRQNNLFGHFNHQHDESFLWINYSCRLFLVILFFRRRK